MNAKDARSFAEQINDPKNQKDIQHIKETILSAIDKGKFQCEYYSHFSDFSKNYFKTQGYTVTSKDCGRNESYYIIGW